MNIVVLDGYTTNPGDLSWGVIKKLGEVKIYDYTAEDEVISRCENMDIIISNKTVLNYNNMSKLKNVKYIGLMSTGYNVIDIEAAGRLGITVTNVPSYGTEAVAQHTFALILELYSRVGIHNEAVHKGEWSDFRRFCFIKAPITEISEKNIGIIGFGRIGQRVAEIAKAFNMKVLFYSRSNKNSVDYEQVAFNMLLEKSDIVTIHCPLNSETFEIINNETIKLMKSDALLINTARGQIINDKAVAEALNNNRLGGAGIDVITTEPPDSANPLLTAKNCIITPHVAWAAKETRIRLLEIVANNIKSYINGNPVNVVNENFKRIKNL